MNTGYTLAVVLATFIVSFIWGVSVQGNVDADKITRCKVTQLTLEQCAQVNGWND